MDIPWDDLRLFLAVAETGTVSGAARRLRVGQPTVSRRLAQLEVLIGQTLFRRGVAGAALTAHGERLLGPARRMAEWAAEVERSAERADGAPRGIVRVTAAPGVAYELLAPFAGWLRQKLPLIQLEVIATVGYLDLTRREADLALRVRPAEGELVQVSRLSFENAAFATKAYARRLKRGYGLADIDWVAWAPPFEDLTPNRELAAAIPNFRPVFAATDFIVQLRAAEAGVGAVFRALTNNRFALPSPLVPLELDLGPHAQGAIHLVSTRSALEIPRVQAVAELLAKELEGAAMPLRARTPRR